MGVLKAIAAANGTLPKVRFDWENASALATALATVQPSDEDRMRLEEAVRCLLFDIWSVMGFLSGAQLESILAGSWAGEVLHRMQEHYEARQAEYRACEEYQDPVNVQKRREDKKRLKQEQHQQRMALQKEHNRIWREKNRKSDDRTN